MTLSLMTLIKNDTQHNADQQNDTRQNDID